MSSWAVVQNGANGSVNATVFRLQKGGDMFNLMVAVGAKVHRVSTVMVDANGKIEGSGTLRLEPAAAGGRFIIDAIANTGMRINGAVICPRFDSPAGNG
jgi:hypothetical protein